MKKTAILFFLTISYSVGGVCQGVRENKTLLLCAHRGGFSSEFPENSIEAIGNTVDKAHETMAVEFDIRKSKDGTLFIMHDESIDRTTNGKGLISELDDRYLKGLFLKTSDGRITKYKILTFDSLLNFALKRDVMLMLDVKADVWAESISKLVSKDLIQKSIVLTFTPGDSKKVYELAKSIRISCLINDEHDWERLKSISIPDQNIIAYVTNKTPISLINKLGEKGIALMMDVSENHKHNSSKPLPIGFYQKLIKNCNLQILISDYALEVSKGLN